MAGEPGVRIVDGEPMFSAAFRDDPHLELVEGYRFVGLAEQAHENAMHAVGDSLEKGLAHQAPPADEIARRRNELQRQDRARNAGRRHR